MLLAIDIGNLETTLGLFQGKRLERRWGVATVLTRMADEYGLQVAGLLDRQGAHVESITGVVMACVVPPLTETWRQVCREYMGRRPLIVGAGIKTGLRIRYEDPRQVGADRVAQAVAAGRLYGKPACVVDFGTATIVDAIDARGDYLGGAITPGLSIAADALFERAAKLPRVELAAPPSVIGRNVTHSIQSGLLYGHAGQVEALVRRFRSELGEDTIVVATGPLAALMAEHTRGIDHVAPALTIEGLRLIHEMNG